MELKVLLFDETISTLGPEIISVVLDVKEDLARSGDMMICATHGMGFAKAVAERVLFLDQGQIVEQNSPTAFFDAPSSERTRKFQELIL